MSTKNKSERGVATVEYTLTVGAIALVAGVLFVQSSAGIIGVWRQATAAANASSAVSTTPASIPAPAFHSVGSKDCMKGAHGNSKVCSTSY